MHEQSTEQRLGVPPRRARRVAGVAVAMTLAGACLAQTAFAQDIDALRTNLTRVQQQQASAQGEITDSAAKINSATARLAESRNALEDAQTRLSDVQVRLAAARDVDANLAARLRAEQALLATAQAEVAQGEANLAEQLRLMGIAARDAYQKQNPLEGLSVVFGAGSTSDLAQRIQWNTTILDAQAASKERLDEVQSQLAAARDRQSEVEAAVAARRQAAARQVAVIRRLEAEASSRAGAVAALVSASERARVSAQTELDADQRSYEQLKAQEDGLQTEIRAELARLKAEAEQRAREEAARKAAEEAARKAAEEAARKAAQEAARRAAEAAQKAADEAAAAQKAAAQAAARDAAARDAAARSAAAPAPAPAVAVPAPAVAVPAPTSAAPVPTAAPPAQAKQSASDPTGYGVSRYGLIRPVDARNGSAFGLRFHPILHYWRMHNGTDFGAATGTPLYAADDGIVLKSGPNGGFGNFVLIGHDSGINGKYVTTGYAHQSRIVVRVGQRVRQGQLIGYVGSTGLSTVSHLHFEVRLDGVPVNPMSYIP